MAYTPKHGSLKILMWLVIRQLKHINFVALLQYIKLVLKLVCFTVRIQASFGVRT